MTWSDAYRYARSHRFAAVALSVAAVAVLSAVLGGVKVPVPSIGDGGVTTGVPFRRELPLLSAVFLVAVLGGEMRDHEQSGGTRLQRVRVLGLAAVASGACAVSFLLESVAVGPAMGAVFVRSLLIWLGLAVLSQRLLGLHLSWVLPVASAFPLVWMGNGPWDWTAAPVADARSWAVTGAALLLGALATAATPWRTRALRVRVFRRHRGAGPRGPRRR
ncbi:hypothetical protein [Streptomyces sp. NRRL B-24484]|uniref:hypothetical protein n=1 Tax=Streptomyces sp. NRRL B-24484 TaxID=1463833 RepID=UPI000694E1EB|nr:hypothetical protein [Streptomyces sp. NRRL B-24484]